jgi:heptosyltransferase-2
VAAPARDWQADLPGASPRRALVLKWSAMGDVVIATAAMQDISEALPGCELHLNTLPAWAHLFAADDRFADVFTVDIRGAERGPRGIARWLARVRRARYDAVIDLQCTDHTRLLLGLLWASGGGVPYRVGYHRRFPYNVAPPPPAPPVHAHTYATAALAAAGIPTRTERPVLRVSGESRAAARALMAEHGLRPGAYGVLLPGCQAAGHLKRWGAERYAALAGRLHAQGLERVLVLGGPDEIDECRAIERRCGPWLLNLCGETAILDLVPLCEGARCVVANDTGTAHVASATGVPMTVICGPTDPARVRPLGSNVRTLQADLPCINCYQKTCSHHSCMAAITPEQVEASVQR